MTVLFIGTDGNDNFTGTGVGQIFGLEGDDTLTSALNPVTPGSELFGNSGEDYLESEGIGDTARGGRDDDYLINTSGQAWLFGDLGDDTIYGEESQYTLFGGAGSDYILATEEQNLIFGDLRDDFSIRADGSDTVPGNDTIVGLDGEDTVLGGGGNDYIVGGPNGESQLFGNQGADSIYAGGDADSLEGGRDADYLLSGSGATNLDNLYIAGNLGQDTILHLNGGDNGIFGGDIEFGTSDSSNSDYLFVADGAGHQIFGNLDDDTLSYGGAGSDANVSLFGGQGDDAISATGGATGLFVSGDKGQDYLDVAASNSTLVGGAGSWSDTLNLISGDGNMLMGASGSDASDDFLMVGSGVGNTLAGGEGNDYLMSNGGGNVLEGAAGDDTYIFGAGDTVVPDTDGNNVYFGLPGADAVEVTLQAGDTVLNGASGQFTFSGDDSQVAFIGTGGAITGDSKDLVSIETASSKTETNDGNDTIQVGMLGTGGSIDAGAGDDILNFTGTVNMGGAVFAGSGNDSINLMALEGGSVSGGPGEDTLTLGSIDGAEVDGGDGNDTINVDTLGASNATTLGGGEGEDTITVGMVGSGGGVLAGGGGNDILLSGMAMGTDSGSVILDGGEGNDFLRGLEYGGDSLNGGAGDDVIYGGAGTSPFGAPGNFPTMGSTEYANAINDAAQGNTGLFDGDTLTGGAGNDIFIVGGINETGTHFFTLNQMPLDGAIADSALGTDLNSPNLDGFLPRAGTGAANDAFATGAYAVDTITDFVSGQDTLAIFEGAAFGGFVLGGTGNEFTPFTSGLAAPAGVVTTKQGTDVIDIDGFGIGTTFGPITDPGDVLYDTSTGGVYLGAGGSQAVLVSVVDPTTSTFGAGDLVFGAPNQTGGITFF